MSRLYIEKTHFKLAKWQYLNIPFFTLRKGEFWTIVGSNGSGKSAFALALQNKLELMSGEYENNFQCIATLSFEKQQDIIEETFKLRNNDAVSH